MAGIIIHGDTGAAAAAETLGASAAGAVEGMQIKAEMEDQIARTQARRQEMDLLAQAAKLQKERDAAQSAWNVARMEADLPGAPTNQGDVVLPHPGVNWSDAQREMFHLLGPEGQGEALNQLKASRDEWDRRSTAGELLEQIGLAEAGVGFNGNGTGQPDPRTAELWDAARAAVQSMVDGEITEQQARDEVRKATRASRSLGQHTALKAKMVDMFERRRNAIIGRAPEGEMPDGMLTEAQETDLERLEDLWDHYMGFLSGDPEDKEYDAKTVGAMAKLSAEDMESIGKFVRARIEIMRMKAPFDPDGSGYDYRGAQAAGMGPSPDGHWSSRDPRTGLLLKGAAHPTWDKTLAEEERLGNTVKRGPDGRWYSLEPGQETGQPSTGKKLSGMPLGDWLGDPENLSPSSIEPPDYQQWGGYGQQPLPPEPDAGPSKAQQLQQDLKDFISGETRDMTHKERNEAVGAWLGKRGIHVPAGEDWVSKFLKMKEENLVETGGGVDS
jgi:hypothetical protein